MPASEDGQNRTNGGVVQRLRALTVLFGTLSDNVRSLSQGKF